MRKSRLQPSTASVRWAAAFLIACASSSDQGGQVRLGERVDVLLQQAVADDDHVAGARPRPGLRRGRRLAVDAGIAGTARSARLGAASCRRRRWAPPPAPGPAARARQQQRQRLQGLAQAHVVGKAGAEAGFCEAHGPRVAVFLIGAQFGLQRPGQDRLPVARRLQALYVWRKSWSVDVCAPSSTSFSHSAARRGMRVPCLSASATAARSASLARRLSVSAA